MMFFLLVHHIGYANHMSPSALSFRHLRPLFATLLVAAGIVVFVVAALASARGLQQSIQLTERRGALYESLVQIEVVLSELKDLETGQRGFLITGDETFLEPYLSARRNIDADFKLMKDQLSDARLAPDFWPRLETLLRERLRVAEQNIALRKKYGAHRFDEPQGLSEGKKVMDAIRHEFASLQVHRRLEIVNISSALDAARRSAFAIALSAGVFGFTLMLGALGLFLREQHLRLNAEAILATANTRLEAEVQARTRDLQGALDRIRAFAGELDREIEAERRRLAREVHDQIGQIFTAMKLLIRPWKNLFEPDTAIQQQFENFSRLMDEGVNTARRITAELQPPLLEELGLGAALEHYFTKIGAPSGLTCRVEMQYDHCLARNQAIALFRIAQEAFTNTMRHAAASRVVVTDQLEGGKYHMMIEDDGNGLSKSAQASFGVRGMEERAKLVDGTLTLSSGVGGGLRIEVSLPALQQSDEVTI